MAKSKKLPQYISRRGLFGYSHLVKPSTKFNADGVFDVQLILSAEEGAAFQAELKKLAEAARDEILSNAKAAEKTKWSKYQLFVPGTQETNQETGEETGNVVFTFKNNAKGTNGGKVFDVVIPIVDAKKKQLANPKVGRGTEGKIAFEAPPFRMDSTKSIGVSLRLKAVQILKLVEWSSSAADAFGEEDGYTGQDFADEGGSDSSETGSANPDLAL